MTEPEIISLDRAEFSHTGWTWPFARERRAQIDAYFAQRRVQAPELWNGQILMVNELAREDAVLRGNFFRTDFASLLAWRDWGYPDLGVKNLFAMGALRSSDGAYLLGVMGAHTANPGRVYFPAGTPDAGDITGDHVDLAGSVLREVEEETGLTTADFDVQPGWTAVMIGPRAALMRPLQAHADAQSLREQVQDYLARQRKPELAGVRIMRSSRDFVPNMPQFMTAFLAGALAD